MGTAEASCATFDMAHDLRTTTAETGMPPAVERLDIFLPWTAFQAALMLGAEAHAWAGEHLASRTPAHEVFIAVDKLLPILQAHTRTLAATYDATWEVL